MLNQNLRKHCVSIESKKPPEPDGLLYLRPRPRLSCRWVSKQMRRARWAFRSGVSAALPIFKTIPAALCRDAATATDLCSTPPEQNLFAASRCGHYGVAHGTAATEAP